MMKLLQRTWWAVVAVPGVVVAGSILAFALTTAEILVGIAMSAVALVGAVLAYAINTARVWHGTRRRIADPR